MQADKRLLIFIILTGGTAVLVSYAYGIFARPEASQALWGGVPVSIRPFYTIGMVLGAAGYFAYTLYILLRVDPQEMRASQRFGFGIFNILYAAILYPSALWLPLTALAVEYPSLASYWLVRTALVVVGAGSVGLLVALLKVKPSQPTWGHRLAVIGSVFFCIQTVLLDAIFWGSAFRP